MADIGIFSGLWNGVSTTLGQGAAEISEFTGSADKKREQELALSKLNLEAMALKAKANQKYLMIGGVILFLIVMVALKKKRAA